MNPYKSLLSLITVLAITGSVIASSTLDDFSDSKNNSHGIERVFADDSSVGGATQTSYSVSNGSLHAQGDITPPRGQPGWASIIFLLQKEGQPQDLSQYEGIRLKIRVNKGNLSVSANSTEITNFDYHASMIGHQRDGEFHEVKVPFSSMKRAWSAQTTLNTETINSISIAAFEMQKGAFDYELDEVGFY